MPDDKVILLDSSEEETASVEEEAKESALPGAQDAENRKVVSRGVTTAIRYVALTRFQRPLIPQK